MTAQEQRIEELATKYYRAIFRAYPTGSIMDVLKEAFREFAQETYPRWRPAEEVVDRLDKQKVYVSQYLQYGDPKANRLYAFEIRNRMINCNYSNVKVLIEEPLPEPARELTLDERVKALEAEIESIKSKL